MSKDRLREILEDTLFGHYKPCDCIHCKEGGKIDKAISEIESLIPSVEEIEGEILGFGGICGDNLDQCLLQSRLCTQAIHNLIKERMKV